MIDDRQVEMRVKLLSQMHQIRHFETRCEQLFREAAVQGAMHLCAGQEAVAVGVCSMLQPEDSLGFTYRSHGWALARGISAVAAFSECLGRTSGCTKGRGGSKHLGDWSRRILPSNAIVAGGVPLVVGVALATKLRAEPGVSVAVFGDGAMNQGAMHESMTIAALWHLPVLFVCENNQYAELTPAMHMQPTQRITDRVAAYDIPAYVCDGMDVEDVVSTARASLAHIRNGDGPAFIEASTYRFCGHMTGDPQAYRTSDEVDSWRLRDPIVLLERRILEDGIDQSVLDTCHESERLLIETAETEAKGAALPEPGDIWASSPSWSLVTR